ncbi:MAG TPA: hypothetical protein VIO16_09730 [Dehalococcoidia bacterium]
MPTNREDLLRILIAPAVAVVLSLIYFAVFNRWEKLADPINSIVIIILGVVGFAAAALIDVQRAKRGRRSSNDTSASEPAG